MPHLGRSSRSSDSGGTYYAVLGVPRHATADDIRRAYRRAAITLHPDKGGDPEAFKELAHAYRVLADPAQRALYDLYDGGGVEERTAKSTAGRRRRKRGSCSSPPAGGFGKDQWTDIGAGGHAFADAARDETLMALLHQRRPVRHSAASVPRRPTRGMHPLHAMSLQEELANNGVSRKGPDVTCPLPVSLDELRNGAAKRLSLFRSVVCSNCNGAGITTRPPASCASCCGKGETEVYCQVGPTMRPVALPCVACDGTGVYFDPDMWDPCAACGGKRVVPERRDLEVAVGRGTRDGDRVTFAGLANEAPGYVAGDVVVVVVLR